MSGKLLTALRSLTLLLCFRVLAHFVSFSRLQAISEVNTQAKTDRPAMPAKAIAHIHNRVCSCLPMRFSCLIRSLALKRLLRTYGHEACLKIGTKITEQGTFRAHAWVEIAGQSVFKDGSLTGFVPVPEKL